MVSPFRIELLKIESVGSRIVAADANELGYTPLSPNSRDVGNQMNREPDRLANTCMR
jgi:hypothetical protein